MKVFLEKQRFNQWWLYLILLIPLISIVLPFIIKNERVVSIKDLSSVIVPVIILILVYSFIFSIQLKTRIDENGIYYQFFPLKFKLKLVSWKELNQCYCRNYRPLTEFGGWGYRGTFSNGKALNIRGNWGIQLVFNNGKKLLIGTQKPEHVKNILETYNHKLSKTNLDNSI